MRYTIARGSGFSELCHNVNGHIDKGWHPVGGIAHVGNVMFQAMIKKETIFVKLKRMFNVRHKATD